LAPHRPFQGKNFRATDVEFPGNPIDRLLDDIDLGLVSVDCR
jgi:hypothetical protein